MWNIPEGLRVAPDGTWHVGELPVAHGAALRWLKQHLVFDAAGAWVRDGDRRLPVRIEGPPLEVLTLRLDPQTGVVRLGLDDGAEETLADGALGMDPESGRFECAVRGGRARARLSRGATQQVLDWVEEHEGGFVLRVGDRTLTLRT